MALFTIALDIDGKKINIDDAQPHGKYFCINCGEQMMARKGQQNEWHFSHYSVTAECNFDHWLHNRIIDLFVTRLNRSESFIVEYSTESIDLSDNISFTREKGFNGLVPDVLIQKTNDVIFVEICVTSPCSEEKIAAGYKIIEILTSDPRVLDELNSGNIHANAKYYDLKFHNFGVVLSKDESESASLRPNSPDILSDESERKIGYSNKSDIYHDGSLPEVTAASQGSLHAGFPASFFVLHSDGGYEIKSRCEYGESDLLVLGINTFADFAINIGKSYAWRKGLMTADQLTEYERHIDMPAVIKSFNIVEYKMSSFL